MLSFIVSAFILRGDLLKTIVDFVDFVDLHSAMAFVDFVEFVGLLNPPWHGKANPEHSCPLYLLTAGMLCTLFLFDGPLRKARVNSAV